MLFVRLVSARQQSKKHRRCSVLRGISRNLVGYLAWVRPPIAGVRNLPKKRIGTRCKSLPCCSEGRERRKALGGEQSKMAWKQRGGGAASGTQVLAVFVTALALGVVLEPVASLQCLQVLFFPNISTSPPLSSFRISSLSPLHVLALRHPPNHPYLSTLQPLPLCLGCHANSLRPAAKSHIERDGGTGSGSRNILTRGLMARRSLATARRRQHLPTAQRVCSTACRSQETHRYSPRPP